VKLTKPVRSVSVNKAVQMDRWGTGLRTVEMPAPSIGGLENGANRRGYDSDGSQREGSLHGGLLSRLETSKR